VANVLSTVPLNISFRRNLGDRNLRDWHRIVASLHDLNLHGESDTFVWSLNASGTFTVKSLYAALINNGVRVSQDIWQVKIPSRIQIFLWYLKRGVILTKDNLSRRNWNGDKSCAFCHYPETIQHLFFNCYYAKFLWRAVHLMFGISPPLSMEDLFVTWSKKSSKPQNALLLTAASALCWTIWLTRNEVVFDKCRPKLYLQVLFRGTYWLRQWAKLQRREVLRDQLLRAGQRLETSALQFFSSNGWLSNNFLG
jgi:hypothetical protein